MQRRKYRLCRMKNNFSVIARAKPEAIQKNKQIWIASPQAARNDEQDKKMLK